MGATRVVTGPVVVLPQENTRLLGYYYQGAVLPDGLDEDRVQAAILDGLVREDVDVLALTIDDLSASAAGDRFRAGNLADGVVETADGIEHVGVLPASAAADEDEDAPPPKAAAKELWVDFAVAQRAEDVDEDTARAEAEAMTKAELIERFGA